MAIVLSILALTLVLVGCGGGGRTRSFLVPSPAMEPTIEAGQTVTVDLDAYKSSPPDRGDVIVFHPTAAVLASCPGSGSPTAFLKRVIGLPGDRVTVQQGHREVLINGTPFEVPHAALNPAQGVTGSVSERTFKVPPGKMFLLGDNRPASCDSHQWSDPYVPEGNVIGKVRL